MTAPQPAALAGDGGRRRLPGGGPSAAIQLIAARMRKPLFWQVQATVGAVTAFHLLMEAWTRNPPFDHLHHLAPALYVFPIIHASLRAGREGGLLTGLWSALLTLPNILLWHQVSGEWLVEVVQIGSAVIVGLVLSARVEHEAAERRRAEELTARVVLVNQKIMRAQEDERLRIARELHDDTVQKLVLLCHRLDGVAATAEMPADARESLQALWTVADETLAGVRQFSRDLRPSILDDLGLVAALEWLTEDFAERSGIDARLDISGTPHRLSSETELALFRIVQEALRNVEKHAGASEVTVRAVFDEGDLRLSVRDDGKGLDPSPSIGHLVASGKLGITGMYERAQLIGASLDLQSEPGAGTLVTAALGGEASAVPSA